MDQDRPVQFGDYFLIEHIATGGMAEIWRAKTIGVEGFERVVAIKYILPSYTKNPEFNAMFVDEARIASTLNHSNIIRITDFGVIDNKYYHEMEFVDGRNLRQLRRKTKEKNIEIPIDSACYIISEVCKGLHYAHMKKDPITNQPLNIIHRDMSPQNIMISYEGEVKILDWGIAKAKGKVEETRVGTLKGKFGYMSPEQAEGEELDRRTDIFSVGIVLFEALTGERLFVADNEINILKKIKETKIPMPSRVNPNIDKELEAIIFKALARNKIERYQTCFDMHESLVHYLYKKFPTYTSLKLASFLQKVFSEEIKEERIRVNQKEHSFTSSYSGIYKKNARNIEDDKTRISDDRSDCIVKVDSVVEEHEPEEKTEFTNDKHKDKTNITVTRADGVDSKKIKNATLNKKEFENLNYEKEGVDKSKRKKITKILLPVLIIIFLALAVLEIIKDDKSGALNYEEHSNVVSENKETVAPIDEKIENQEYTQNDLQNNAQNDAQKKIENNVESIQEDQTFDIKAETPVLNINTYPEGVSIFIDGVFIGKAPLEYTNLSLDKRYRLSLELKGYEREEKFFTLKDINNSISFNMKALEIGSSFLTIEVEPPVLIYLNDKLVSEYRPLDKFSVNPGTHDIRLYNKNLSIDYKLKVEVKEGMHERKQIFLR